MKQLETERLVLRGLEASDAAFVYRIANDPAWLRYIGDRNVRSLDDAKAYIRDGPRAMYARHGFGLLLVESRHDRTPMGLCGLIKRDELDDVDLGFAFLPEFRGQGFARESASATMAHGAAAHGLSRLVAITLPGNHASIALLERLGFRREDVIVMEAGADPVALYAVDLRAIDSDTPG